MRDDRRAAVIFYTDGSKLEENNPVEAGIFSSELDLNESKSYKLPSVLSIFFTEAWASYYWSHTLEDED